MIDLEILYAGGGNGFGLGFHEGKAVLVPGAVVGDIVQVKPEKTGKNFYGKILKVVELSQHRVEMQCPYAFNPENPLASFCGGCPMMGTSLSFVRESKLHMVKRAFRQSGVKLVSPQEIESVSSGLKYRDRIRCRLTDSGAGFMEPLSDNVKTVQNCQVAEFGTDLSFLNLISIPGTELSVLWNSDGEFGIDVRGKITKNGIAAVTEASGGRLKVVSRDNIHVHGDKYIQIDDGINPHLNLKPGNFFQPGIQANIAILRALDSLLSEIDLSGRDILELYAGSGNITRLLVKYGTTAAVESVDTSDAMRINAPKAEFIKSRTSGFKPGMKKYGLCVADPPRTGLDRETLQMLLELKPEYIILVSCDPMTGMRDLGNLVKGGYTHKKVKVLDTMPWTPHMEIISLLAQ
ncbi:MAG: class I SAM-dependent RNA methyltransferase [Deltaproteobacteria bacterium]|nr:class I SAM-dependent RNA methyltransferase [Deltaproteobacteria bacterium]